MSRPAETKHGFLELPAGWRREQARGPGPFVTTETLEAPDGTLVRWRSRAHRKHRPDPRGRVWWRPAATRGGSAVLFGLGSLCFAARQSCRSGLRSRARDRRDVLRRLAPLHGWRLSPVQQAVNTEHRPPSQAARSRWRPASWEPRRIEWLASAIQLAGTLFFNVSTFEGMKRGFDPKQADLRVWTPDVAGSICFLVSSELAYAEVCGRWICLYSRSPSWRIVAVNLLGSLAFGVSAITSLVEPSTGEPLSAAIANATTTAGALCFLTGAVLLIPEAAREPPDAGAEIHGSG